MLNNPEGVTVDSAGNMYVLDDNHRVSKYDSAGVFQGWIGSIATSPTGGASGCNGASVGTFTPGWCKGGTSTSGTGDGMLNTPTDAAIDSSGNIYVADSGNSRINKYDSTGAFIGWIGKIATSPTGGATGCSGASVGTATPGWCQGGTSSSGSGDGMLSSPTKISLDSAGNLYVIDMNAHRLVKYDSSGAFLGWLGKINTSPTGGAAGCNGAAVGTFTPGWCKGGTAWVGFGDGMMYYPRGVALDSSGNIFVLDSSNQRVSKYNSLGAFQGWIGKIGTSPTGGATGCNGAAVGTFTPGWCKGGGAATGNGDGMLSYPLGLTLDSSGNIYVADSNHRISKFNSSGAFLGWIGMAATAPTGGATGCKAVAANGATPGLCKGGTSGPGFLDGMLNTPTGIAIDKSGNLYITDQSNHRVVRYSLQGK
jgi:sugar lactone lactonase YvrE